MSREIDLPFLNKLRLVGIIEGISTLVLFGVAMPLKYMAQMPFAVTIAGSIHGLLFTILVLLFFLAVKKVPLEQKLAFQGIVAAVFPFGPFIIEKRLKLLAEKV